MQLVAFVRVKHEKYVNKWTRDFSRLESITTDPAFGERLGKACRNGEAVVIYDPGRKISLLSKVLSAKPFDDCWYVTFDADSQTPSANPSVGFAAGKHGADVLNDKVVTYY